MVPTTQRIPHIPSIFLAYCTARAQVVLSLHGQSHAASCLTHCLAQPPLPPPHPLPPPPHPLPPPPHPLPPPPLHHQTKTQAARRRSRRKSRVIGVRLDMKSTVKQLAKLAFRALLEEKKAAGDEAEGDE